MNKPKRERLMVCTKRYKHCNWRVKIVHLLPNFFYSLLAPTLIFLPFTNSNFWILFCHSIILPNSISISQLGYNLLLQISTKISHLLPLLHQFLPVPMDNCCKPSRIATISFLCIDSEKEVNIHKKISDKHN